MHLFKNFFKKLLGIKNKPLTFKWIKQCNIFFNILFFSELELINKITFDFELN